MKADLMKLAERVEALACGDNAVDVLVEIALFEPAKMERSMRANAAGTKVIVTYDDGTEQTMWAGDHTITKRDRETTAAALRARAAMEMTEGQLDALEDWIVAIVYDEDRGADIATAVRRREMREAVKQAFNGDDR